MLLLGVSVYCFASAFGWHLPQRHGDSDQIDWTADWGSVADWVAAFGSTAAALAALFIATRDRRDRMRERIAADEAQAKLVMVKAHLGKDTLGVMYGVDVKNHGGQPILDLSMRSARIGTYPRATIELSNWSQDIVDPGKEGHLQARFRAEDGETVPGEIEIAAFPGGSFMGYPNIDTLDIEVWVEYADASGNRWAKSNRHELRWLGRLAKAPRR